MMLRGLFLFMREENLVNDNERALLRYVVEGDIRKSQQQAKIVLEGLTTDKDKAFKETCLRTLASKSPTLIELPYNLQGLLVAEDSSTFREDRFLIRDDEKAVIVKMCKTRRAALLLPDKQRGYKEICLGMATVRARRYRCLLLSGISVHCLLLSIPDAARLTGFS